MRVLVAVAFGLALTSSAAAQSPAEFYRGKTIELDIGTSIGGGYDVQGRLLARYMSKHMPGNPTVVAKNMEGASGLRLANLLYNTAPQDGTVFGITLRNAPYEPMFGNKAAQFDARKFSWIGSASNEVSVCVAWHTTGVTTLRDLFTRDLLVGANGAVADLAVFPKIINGVLGTRMKVVNGYAGGNEVMLALERGEVGGRCAWSWSAARATRKDWIESNQVNIFVQTALRKHPDLPNVPLIMDFAKTDADRNIFKLLFARQEIAWPYVAPPNVPADRVQALRTAFLQTMKDTDFLAEARKASLEIAPLSGEDVQELIGEIYATPHAVVQRAMDMLK